MISKIEVELSHPGVLQINKSEFGAFIAKSKELNDIFIIYECIKKRSGKERLSILEMSLYVNDPIPDWLTTVDSSLFNPEVVRIYN